MFARLVFVGAALALAGCASVVARDAEPIARVIPADQQAFLDTCEDWDDWEKPAPPFRIYGNSYYVGSCGIASILVTGNDGHILIDGGSRGGGRLVEAGIERLGFRIEDVKILLHSHEHFDHVGGLAVLQRKSGAKVISSSGAKNALQTGETQLGDPQHGMHNPFEPVAVARTVGSYEPVSVGNLTLMPIETPGHTPGALSWQWWSCEKTDCKMLVYADSLTPLGSDDYSFSDHPVYLADFRTSLATLADLPCDILATPHPSASWMLERMQSDSGLVTSGACAKYAAGIGARLDEELAIEASEK